MASILEEAAVSRRKFLSRALGLIAALISGAVATPVLGYFLSPAITKGKASAAWQDIGPLEDFPIGKAVAVPFASRERDGWVTKEITRAVWVLRRSEDNFWVYNPHCTHLGCYVNWQENTQTFNSHCHGGIFAKDGIVLGGPPPRPLDTLDWKVQKGRLQIVYKDFLVGLPDKKEV